MSDDPRHRDAGDERLSTYLSGEMSPEDAARFEDDLAADPRLRAQLDVLADALVVLHGADDVAEPDGLDQRLHERLAQERAQDAPGAVDAGTTAAGTVTDLDDHRRCRSPPTRSSSGSAAAVMGANALSGMGGMGASGVSAEGGDDAAVDMAQESAVQEDTAEAGAAFADGPVIVQDGARVRSEAALARRYDGLPEVAAVLGTPVTDAGEVADRYRAEVGGTAAAQSQARAGAGTDDGGELSGDSPVVSAAPEPDFARCLDTVSEGADEPLVVARVETLHYRQTPAIAYVLVTASPGAAALDRTEVWVVAAADCRTLVFQQS
ncbi:MAG TPA: hypothetical protein VM307_14340 [Egibacteraceae bacterium]|nr:hypothetical protein [Egibacteraceae bacterium]